MENEEMNIHLDLQVGVPSLNPKKNSEGFSTLIPGTFGKAPQTEGAGQLLKSLQWIWFMGKSFKKTYPTWAIKMMVGSWFRRSFLFNYGDGWVSPMWRFLGMYCK